MANKQIKMLTSIEGDAISAACGSIISIDVAVAAEWIAAGMAIEAPGVDVAAGRIAELEKRLADTEGARAGLDAENTDLRGQVANLSGAVKGAEKDRDTYKADLIEAGKAARKLQAQIIDAQRAIDDVKTQAAADVAAAQKAADEFKAQAEELGEQLAAAQAAPVPAA